MAEREWKEGRGAETGIEIGEETGAGVGAAAIAERGCGIRIRAGVGAEIRAGGWTLTAESEEGHMIMTKDIGDGAGVEVGSEHEIGTSDSEEQVEMKGIE